MRGVGPAGLIEKGDEISCYTRHLGDLFAAAGIENTEENRKKADGFIREIMAMKEEGYPVVWREVKSRLADPDKSLELAHQLHQAFAKA
ncbi:MAG TPA: hypothetical protein DCP08_07975 [Chloroflexi bacterium]|nr:hypothetical protein [Chloroflexota bacterium]